MYIYNMRLLKQEDNRYKLNLDKIVFIYRIHDNCLFQLGTLKQNENVILDIPSDSYLSVKRGNLVGEILVPNETILETHIQSNHYFCLILAEELLY